MDFDEIFILTTGVYLIYVSKYNMIPRAELVEQQVPRG